MKCSFSSLEKMARELLLNIQYIKRAKNITKKIKVSICKIPQRVSKERQEDENKNNVLFNCLHRMSFPLALPQIPKWLG